MSKERVFEKLKEIEENLDIIQENLPHSVEEFKKIGLIKDGIYKKLEYCIENLIDIFSMIYSDLNIGIPSDDDDVLDGLKEKKTFSKEVIELVRNMKGLRNILVHKYGEIDDGIVYELLTERLSDFDKISKEITDHFKK